MTYAKAVCAACGTPVDLTELHTAIVRQLEREVPGDVRILESVVLQYRHLDCPAYLTRTPNGEITRVTTEVA